MTAPRLAPRTGPYSSSARDVYSALTADYGTDKRTSGNQANNVLDLDGLLHVKDVDRFIEALWDWQADVRRQQSRRDRSGR